MNITYEIITIKLIYETSHEWAQIENSYIC